jgi:hypothetical protein
MFVTAGATAYVIMSVFTSATNCVMLVIAGATAYVIMSVVTSATNYVTVFVTADATALVKLPTAIKNNKFVLIEVFTELLMTVRFW